MKRTLYVLQEALTGFRVYRANSVIGVITTAFTLASFGLYGLVYVNVKNMIHTLQDDLQIVVYLQDEVSEDERRQLEQRLKGDDRIEAITFISKAQALEEFRQQFPEESQILEGIGPNPLPAAFVITVTSAHGTSSDVAEFGRQLAEFPGVEHVRYNQDWLERLTLVIRYFELGAIVMGGILALASATIIANTVRLAFYMRKEEVEILQLIGATGLFIALPYILEGAILGAMGGGAALGLLWGGFELFRVKLGEMAWLGGVRSLLTFFPAPMSVLLVLMGMTLGSVASFLSVRSWMKVRV